MTADEGKICMDEWRMLTATASITVSAMGARWCACVIACLCAREYGECMCIVRKKSYTGGKIQCELSLWQSSTHSYAEGVVATAATMETFSSTVRLSLRDKITEFTPNYCVNATNAIRPDPKLKGNFHENAVC